MKFFLSQRAAVEVKQLSKKKPTKNVKQDICSFFIALETIENIRNVDETLGPKGKNSTIKKSRVTNSILNEKSGGYRLYFIISE
jgi:ribosomal protein L1